MAASASPQEPITHLGPPSSPLSISFSCVSTLHCTVRKTTTSCHCLYGRWNPLRLLHAIVWRISTMSCVQCPTKPERSRWSSRGERAGTTHLLHAFIFWITLEFCCDTKHKYLLKRCLGVVSKIVALSPWIIYIYKTSSAFVRDVNLKGRKCCLTKSSVVELFLFGQNTWTFA